MSALLWLFTHFVQAAVHHLCHQGMQVMAYMDNFIVIGHSHRQALEHTTRTLCLLNQLGWQVNFKKSNLMPSQSKEFLGLLINTTGPPLFKVPPCKSHALWHNINHFRQQGRVPVWKLATVIGQGVALTKAILPAKLLLHNPYHNIAWRANWNSLVPLSAATILDLKDWRHGLSTWNGHLANLRPCSILLNTDASLTGWGASLGATLSSPTHTSAGWWPPSKQHHINVLKITAVHNALKSFLPLLQGKAVRIHCNNIATMAHLNHMGGRSPPMNNVMRIIHQLCKSSHIQLTATYLPGVDNMVADCLSHLWPHHKWKLAPAMFCRLDQCWGPHTINRDSISLQLPTSPLQLLVLRSQEQGSGLPAPILEQGQQLGHSPYCPYPTHPQLSQETVRNGDNHCCQVARLLLVQPP